MLPSLLAAFSPPSGVSVDFSASALAASTLAMAVPENAAASIPMLAAAKIFLFMGYTLVGGWGGSELIAERNEHVVAVAQAVAQRAARVPRIPDFADVRRQVVEAQAERDLLA